MKSGTKVFLETIRVARHVSRLGARPVEKAAVQALAAGEEIATWALKSQVVEDVLGKQRSQQVVESYLQAKDVVAESFASLSHQSLMTALQSGSQAATSAMHQAGVEGRVIGPFDEHWNMRKVVRDLRSASTEVEKSKPGRNQSQQLQLTPKRFVQFMREAQRKKKRLLRRDPIDAYVERLLGSGGLGGGSSSMGPMLLEKRIYTEVAGIICFAFDQALIQADGTQLWGHELHIKRRRAREADMMEALASPVPSSVGVKQVEAIVDKMLLSEDLHVMALMQGVQRKMLVNCSMMVLQLLEYLTSDQRMQVSVLGHSLRFRLEPLPLEEVLVQAMVEEDAAPRFHVNSKALDELVDALLDDDSEMHSVFVPDVLEAEVFRAVLHRMICITQLILQQLRITLFGIEVRLNLVAEDDNPSLGGQSTKAKENDVSVLPVQLQTCLNRLEEERRRLIAEIEVRKEGAEARIAGERAEAAGDTADDAPSAAREEEGEPTEHEFLRLAAQDRLARSLAISHNIRVPIDMAFRMVSDFDEYPKWMPFCTSARTLETSGSQMKCEVGFGLETGTMLGTVGDNIRYNVMLVRPYVKDNEAAGSQSIKGGATHLRKARVVADTMDGFAYGKRLVYDWRFAEMPSGETAVQLDIFFQAKNVFSLPLWDSMQAMITSVMMKKFIERAATLERDSGSALLKQAAKLHAEDAKRSAEDAKRTAASSQAPRA